MRTFDELLRIAYAGGGFSISANAFTSDELLRIAYAAKNKAAQIKITNTMGLTFDELLRIAYAGDGSVFFEEI